MVDFMGANAAEDVIVFFDGEGEAVGSGDASLPNVPMAGNLSGSQRRMHGVLDKELELPCCTTLNRFRKGNILLLKAIATDNSHELRFLMKSSTVSKAFTRPARVSASASRSPFCHSSIHQ